MGKKEERRRATFMRIYQVSQVTPELAREDSTNKTLQSKIFPSQTTSSFHATVRRHLLDEMRDLDPTALLIMKSLIKRGLYEKNDPDAVNLRESYGYVELFHLFLEITILILANFL
jgi:hypothetical protein